MLNKWNKEYLEVLVKDCNSIADFLRKLDIEPIGGNYRTAKKYIEMFDLDVSHFTGQLWNKGKQLKDFRHYTSISNVKRYFEKTVKYQCVKCGLGNFYNGKQLVLHLDHIDGNNLNNSIENLRLLCPNCHSQTDTYCARNKKNKKTSNNSFDFLPAKEPKKVKERKIKPKEVHHCCDCAATISSRATRCKSCAVALTAVHKFEVSKEELEQLIINHSMVQIGKMFGVSDNSVRKRAKKFGLLS